MPSKPKSTNSTPAAADEVEVVFVNHTRTHVPGERTTVSAAEARRLVRGHAAQYATKADATGAGDPDGPTPRSS